LRGGLLIIEGYFFYYKAELDAPTPERPSGMGFGMMQADIEDQAKILDEDKLAAASESKHSRTEKGQTWKTLVEWSGTTHQVPWNYEKSDTATQCQKLRRAKAYAFMDMAADFVNCNSNELEAWMAE
jgi:hypothetical protein